MKIAYYKELEDGLQRVIIEVEDNIFDTAKRVVRLTKNLCLIFNDEVKEIKPKISLTIINLTLYKTAEVIEYTESELNITHNATPTLKDGSVNINLSSEQTEGITFVTRLYLVNTEELIYESKEMQAGEGVAKIELSTELETGEHECSLICESYKNGNYLGTTKK